MSDIHAIQSQLVERIGQRPIGSASRFRLMDAADAVSRAIEAEAKEAGAQIGGNHPISEEQPASEAGADIEGNQQ